MLDSASKESAQAAKATHATKLAKLGLEIDVPGEAVVGDALDPASVAVNAVSVGALGIGPAQTAPKTLKAAKAQAQSLRPTNVQGEQTTGGYWLTFDSPGTDGSLHWVKTLQTIGKKSYSCEGTVTSEQAAAALAACKTLRPLS